MKRVNAVGYYGWGNFGDELFRAAIEYRKDLIWGEGTRLRTFVNPVKTVHQNLGLVGTASRLIASLAGALWADTIALCGGSVLEDLRGTQQIRSKIARRGRSVEGLGISLGPWASEDARLKVRNYVKQMDRVVVRDEASKTRIKGNVILGGDLAALYPMPELPLEDRQHLTICISNDSGTNVDKLTEYFSVLLADVRIPVKLLALNVRREHGDIELTQELAKRLSTNRLDIEVVQYETIDQTIGVIASSQAVWSQRLHGLIVAYLCEVPILALSHHQKISDFCDYIELPRDFVREDFSVDDFLVRAAIATLNTKPQWGLSSKDYKQVTLDAFTKSDDERQPPAPGYQ